VITNSFYGTELGLPLFLLVSTRLDRLAPYSYFTFLAGTHNYLAGIHNYFLTFRTITTVHHGLPLGGWYCTISFLFFECAAKIDGILSLPRISIMPSLAPPTLSVRNFPVVSITFAFCFFLASDDRVMGFRDSSCLFFDLIPFIYLLS